MSLFSEFIGDNNMYNADLYTPLLAQQKGLRASKYRQYQMYRKMLEVQDSSCSIADNFGEQIQQKVNIFSKNISDKFGNKLKSIENKINNAVIYLQEKIDNMQPNQGGIKRSEIMRQQVKQQNNTVQGNKQQPKIQQIYKAPTAQNSGPQIYIHKK